MHLDRPAQVPDADRSRLATRMQPGKRGVERNMTQTSKMINTDFKSYQVSEMGWLASWWCFRSDLWCDQIGLPKIQVVEVVSQAARTGRLTASQPPPALFLSLSPGSCVSEKKLINTQRSLDRFLSDEIYPLYT
jgi:hypothetical protein